MLEPSRSRHPQSNEGSTGKLGCAGRTFLYHPFEHSEDPDDQDPLRTPLRGPRRGSAASVAAVRGGLRPLRPLAPRRDRVFRALSPPQRHLGAREHARGGRLSARRGRVPINEAGDDKRRPTTGPPQDSAVGATLVVARLRATHAVGSPTRATTRVAPTGCTSSCRGTRRARGGAVGRRRSGRRRCCRASNRARSLRFSRPRWDDADEIAVALCGVA